jgi:hypothetical protein
MKWSDEESTERSQEREVEVRGGIKEAKEGLGHEGEASSLTFCCMCISPSYRCHSP